MKKTYIIPITCVMWTQCELPLAGSGVTSDMGIGYGGVDEDGTLDPAVKANPFGDSLFD